jgi:hypothetical protein
VGEGERRTRTPYSTETNDERCSSVPSVQLGIRQRTSSDASSYLIRTNGVHRNMSSRRMQGQGLAGKLLYFCIAKCLLWALIDKHSDCGMPKSEIQTQNNRQQLIQFIVRTQAQRSGSAAGKAQEHNSTPTVTQQLRPHLRISYGSAHSRLSSRSTASATRRTSYHWTGQRKCQCLSNKDHSL